MHSSLDSLIGPHDLPLVAVAAAMCFFASYVTVRVNRRLRGMNAAAERRRWFLGAVVTGGTSIWTTHFLAVLAYQPELSLSFEPVRTGLSLVLAMGTAAAVWSVCSRSIARLLVGGLAMGLGTAGMHYLGMSAVHFHGDFAWNLHLIGLSAVPGILFGTAALAVFERWSAPSADVVTAGLLTLAICLLHFTGMAAATIHHDAAVQHLFALVDRGELAIGVIASAGIVLSIGFVSAMAAQRFEQAQREMARMRTIADAVVEGIAICDGDVFREVNASFAILVGCDASSLVGRPVSDVLLVRTGAGPIAGEAAQATLADLLARSGERIPVEIVERTIVQPDGHRRLLSVRDLRGRLKLRRLRGIERAAIRMASATSDAVICANSTGRITIWNRAAEAMFGHSRSQAIGRSFDIIFPERHRAAHRAVFERLSRGEATKSADRFWK